MATSKYRMQALENIALQVLKSYNAALVTGEPCAIPIEDIVEQHYGLAVEYQCLSKKGHILGLTVFEDSLVPVYDMEQKRYDAICVKGGTVLIDTRLLESKTDGRLRFTFAHELAHWLRHKEYYMNHGETAAKTSKGTDKSNEREADIMGAALLMPLGRVKVAFYRQCGQGSTEQVINGLAHIFHVSCQAMEIRLKSSGLILGKTNFFDPIVYTVYRTTNKGVNSMISAQKTALHKKEIRCPLCYYRLLDLSYPAHAVKANENTDATITTRCARCKRIIDIVIEDIPSCCRSGRCHWTGSSLCRKIRRFSGRRSLRKNVPKSTAAEDANSVYCLQ